VLQASNCHTRRPPHISNEIWWEIASFLPRRDLRSLISVPHALSLIARRLLFRDVSLQLGGSKLDVQDRAFDPVEMDKWHARRSAEILSHLISYPARASQVRSLTVCSANYERNIVFSYFMGMLTLLLNCNLVDQRTQRRSLPPLRNLSI
jgi:hypothetical protein